jgi:hypothetical protein
MTLYMEGTATQGAESSPGAVVELAHPFHEVETGGVY